jgi:integrase
MRLTKDTMATLSLPPGKAELFVWDDTLPGFGIRLRGQRKSYVVQYRVGAQQRRESLGDVRKVTLDAARKIARQRFAQAELGVDPGAARTAAPVLTLGEVADRYLEARHDRLAPPTFKQASRHLTVLWRPLRERPLAAVTRAEIASRLQELIRDNGRTAAGRARRHLSTMYVWAIGEGLCDANPIIGTNDPAAGLPSRERVLDDRELRTVWDACGDDNFGRVVRLLILTGCRRNEIGALRWSELDFDTGLLTIPGSRTKSRRALELPLPEPALAILRAVPRRENCDYVFGRRMGPFTGWSAAKLQFDARLAIGGQVLAPWLLHDLRRTMRSGLGQLGIRPDIAELAIGHARSGVQAVYDRYRYRREIGEALAKWAEHVVGDAGERKVIPLRA